MVLSLSLSPHMLPIILHFSSDTTAPLTLSMAPVPFYSQKYCSVIGINKEA